MGAAITLAGEDLIAQKQATKQPLDVARFVFANVPGLNPNTPVDRAASKPPAGQIVHTATIASDDKGYVNPSQVVYSVMLGSDVGDWDFNWVALESAEGVLFAVSYVPLQQKRRNIPPLQIGNNLTRNFLVVFDGAQALTGITIDASTWQADFTARLQGIDERERQSNRDVYGRACFFGSNLQVEKVGSVYQLKPGTAYVEGIRLERAAVLPVAPPAFPTTAWLDVALQRELSDVVASWKVVFGADKADYTDSAGVRHYCVAIADLPNSNTITDRRPVEAIGGPLVAHFAARVGDYADLRARATTKGDVGLSELPNAKSDDPATDSSEILATTKAVKTAITRIAQHEDATDPHPQYSLRGAFTSLAVNTTLTTAHEGAVLIDASAGARTITLPPSNAELGVRDYFLRRFDNSGNRLVIQASGTDKIKFHTHLRADGYPFLVLMGAGDYWHLRSDGAGNWWPVARRDNSQLGRLSFETSTAIQPGGYGLPHGVMLIRGDWPWLWDHAQASGMLVDDAARAGFEGCWTRGDGVTTMRSPEVRGEFLRALDEGRGVDDGRPAGSWKTDQLRQHSHGLPISAGGGENLPFELTETSAGNDRSDGVQSGTTGGTETYPRHTANPKRIKMI